MQQIAFDGTRQHLGQDFTRIYHLNLQGIVRQNPKLSGTAYNVFGIQVGVGITVAIRKAGACRGIYYHAVPLNWRREKKLDWLARRDGLREIKRERLHPDERNTWLVPEHAQEFGVMLPIAQKKGKEATEAAGETVFDKYSLGVTTSRDEWMYGFSEDALREKVELFIETYNAEVDRWKRRKDRTVKADAFVHYDGKRIKWSRDLKLDIVRGKYAESCDSKVRRTLYRPFQNRLLFYDSICNEEHARMPYFSGRRVPLRDGLVQVAMHNQAHRAQAAARLRALAENRRPSISSSGWRTVRRRCGVGASIVRCRPAAAAPGGSRRTPPRTGSRSAAIRSAVPWPAAGSDRCPGNW